ncbi:GNAT family N-acetyltransferase [Pseudovibrio sp. Tun.PSC04-5.I4]|uniref:GNAT family N-acetyltransferase n=1 Tax=Pseudovibrio sp. Tun.PSC04-5.I4 TaxID=1798213 RepID=UPI000884C61D|nr:GNAT family N-acetyltransferase [Pseudovibrio sp. Tun.PSC04-5.I4]SDQ18283.1 Ribosomal protein S18 acetylase RimI [Pseudovibrio sp. Tun.PSC04-5.I4]
MPGLVIQNEIEISLFCDEDRQNLREFLAAAWLEAHTDELGEELSSLLVSRLDAPDLGGVIPSDNGCVYLARSISGIVGSLVCAHRGEVVHIWACYLARHYQRKGLGRRMLKIAMAEYSSEFVAGLYVLKQSTSAQAFYTRLGFIDCGEVQFEVVPGTYTPARIMQARIGNLVLG